MKLVIADITKTEVHARIDKNLENFAALKHFQKNARVLRSSPLPEVVGVFTELDRDEVATNIHEAFDEFLDQHDATVVDATEQDAAPIFEKYFAGKPPFGSGEKRKEFPDAFVADSLIEWTDDESQELFVVSGDDLFVEACKECKELHPVKDLVDLLDHVASDDRKLPTSSARRSRNTWMRSRRRPRPSFRISGSTWTTNGETLSSKSRTSSSMRSPISWISTGTR